MSPGICFHCGDQLVPGFKQVNYHGYPVKVHAHCMKSFRLDQELDSVTARPSQQGSYNEDLPTPTGFEEEFIEEEVDGD